MLSHQLTILFLVTLGVSGDTANSAPENWTGFCFTSSRFRLRGISLLAKQTKDAFVHSSLDLLVWLARSFKWTRSCFDVLIYYAVSVVRMAERSKAPDSRFNSFCRFLQSESVLVHVCGRGFESHFWHRLFFLLFYCTSLGSVSPAAMLSRILNSMKPAAPFRHFCISKVITTAHPHKSGVDVIFRIFPSAFKQKKIKDVRPNLMTKIAWRGGVLLRPHPLCHLPGASTLAGEQPW